MLVITQIDCRPNSGRDGLKHTAWRRSGHEVDRLNKPLRVEPAVRSYLRRASERNQRSRVYRQITVEFRAAYVGAKCKPVAAESNRHVVGQLISVVDAALREVENIHTGRAKARNRHLAQRPQNIFRIEIEETVIEHIVR